MSKLLWRTAIIVGLSVGLAACIPEFVNPLVGGNPADPDIIGTWSGKGADDSAKMPVEIAADGQGLKVDIKDPEATPESNNDMHFTGTTAEIGGVRYINLKPVGADVPPDVGNMIFRYEIVGGEVHVHDLDEAKIKAAIDAGQLKGTSGGSGSDSSPKITASSEELAAFFATPAGQATFESGTGDILVLTRATP